MKYTNSFHKSLIPNSFHQALLMFRPNYEQFSEFCVMFEINSTHYMKKEFDKSCSLRRMHMQKNISSLAFLSSDPRLGSRFSLDIVLHMHTQLFHHPQNIPRTNEKKMLLQQQIKKNGISEPKCDSPSPHILSGISGCITCLSWPIVHIAKTMKKNGSNGSRRSIEIYLKHFSAASSLSFQFHLSVGLVWLPYSGRCRHRL